MIAMDRSAYHDKSKRATRHGDNFNVLKILRSLGHSETWLTIVVLAMVIYQLLYTQLLLYEPNIHRIIHLGFAFLVVSLAIFAARASQVKRLSALLIFIISLIITAYLALIYPKMAMVMILPPPGVMLAGAISLVFCFVIVWWRYGKLFPLIALTAIVYAIAGPHFLPDGIAPPEVSLLRLLSWTAADIKHDWGVYGDLVGFLANYMWLFMIFGAFLQAFGGIRFVYKLGILASTRFASGPAMLSVVTSALVGMVTGSTNANQAITGSFTIPLMKRRGYSPEQAGAIEMAASNGGQILPPIMGVAAFVMAEFIGMPYKQMIIYAIVPALLYFVTLAIYVQLQAMKARLTPEVIRIDVKDMMLDAPLFIIPFFVLVSLLMKGFSLMFVAFWSIVTTSVLGIASGYLRKGAKIDWQEAKERLVQGAIMASEVTIVVGLLGALTAILEMSGLGITLANLALRLSGGSQFLLLVFAALVGLILGTGLPTIAAYVFVATILAPPIVALGVPLIAVHLFILVYAVFANITPPIGVGIIVSQRLANATYMGTAREGLKAAFLAFFLPFFYIYTPAIILQFEGLSLVNIISQFCIVIVFMVSMSCVINNYAFLRLGIAEKLLFVLAGGLSILAIIVSKQDWLLVTPGLAGCIGSLIWNLWRAKTSVQTN